MGWNVTHSCCSFMWLIHFFLRNIILRSKNGWCCPFMVDRSCVNLYTNIWHILGQNNTKITPLCTLPDIAFTNLFIRCILQLDLLSFYTVIFCVCDIHLQMKLGKSISPWYHKSSELRSHVFLSIHAFMFSVHEKIPSQIYSSRCAIDINVYIYIDR